MNSDNRTGGARSRWTVEGEHVVCRTSFAGGDRLQVVAKVQKKRSGKEQEANAVLLASAPEMFDMLRTILAAPPDPGTDLEMCAALEEAAKLVVRVTGGRG